MACECHPILECIPERDLAAHGIGLVASTGQAAQAAEALLRRRYSWAEADAAQTLVALGGDGFMLQTLHAMLEEGEARPVFGMNRGTFGFLMNDWRLDRLYERIQDAKHIASLRSPWRQPTFTAGLGASGDQ